MRTFKELLEEAPTGMWKEYKIHEDGKKALKRAADMANGTFKVNKTGKIARDRNTDVWRVILDVPVTRKSGGKEMVIGLTFTWEKDLDTPAGEMWVVKVYVHGSRLGREFMDSEALVKIIQKEGFNVK